MSQIVLAALRSPKCYCSTRQRIESSSKYPVAVTLSRPKDRQAGVGATAISQETVAEAHIPRRLGLRGAELEELREPRGQLRFDRHLCHGAASTCLRKPLFRNFAS